MLARGVDVEEIMREAGPADEAAPRRRPATNAAAPAVALAEVLTARPAVPGRRSPAAISVEPRASRASSKRRNGAAARAGDVAAARFARQAQCVDDQSRMQALEERRGGRGEDSGVRRDVRRPARLRPRKYGVLVPTPTAR